MSEPGLGANLLHGGPVHGGPIYAGPLPAPTVLILTLTALNGEWATFDHLYEDSVGRLDLSVDAWQRGGRPSVVSVEITSARDV